ncbi:hypothetical protein BCR37DRAFT_395983 [Protomyces lactucae-debilis]|uniref:Uncharacterized protein n=1 Tax=Protomyces lactucae-debilis TaxID=2754530 RepID=A0A1Y2EQ18_PROLT|nr:uncharacterized protein BCR37DRAFT_395983 [Protomyces lactucae-debilis]ORY73384.1 hypothetical protein BCR37DRAFT_395983 [Protomyces lactucae-debilis]
MHRSSTFNKYDAVYLATGFSKESHWWADCADLRGTRPELVPSHGAVLAVHAIISGQPPSNQVSGMLSDCQRLLSESDLLDLLKLYPGLRKLRLMAVRQATLTFEDKRDLRRVLKLHVPLIQGPHFATTFETLDDAEDVNPRSSGSAKTKDEVKAMVVRWPTGALLSPKLNSGETARLGVEVIL